MKERTREDVAVECLERGDISVDDQGRFWRHRKRVGGMAHKVVEVRRERAEYVSKSGRLELKVYENGWRYTCQAHRLVWLLAYGEIPEGHRVAHISDDKADNRLSNLKLYETRSAESHFPRRKVVLDLGTDL
jgi:hypothetical protein